MTEDELKSAKEEVQELTKKFENKVGELTRAKETEVMDD
jgi:ribosome recycling factor